MYILKSACCRSVRTFADDFLKKDVPLDILATNASAWMVPESMSPTEDGFEVTTQFFCQVSILGTNWIIPPAHIKLWALYCIEYCLSDTEERIWSSHSDNKLESRCKGSIQSLPLETKLVVFCVVSSSFRILWASIFDWAFEGETDFKCTFSLDLDHKCSRNFGNNQLGQSWVSLQNSRSEFWNSLLDQAILHFTLFHTGYVMVTNLGIRNIALNFSLSFAKL